MTIARLKPRLALVAVVAFLLGASPAGWARTGDDAPRYMRVPVLYLTDRNDAGKTYGTQRKYITDCKHDPFYGTLFYNVKNVDGRYLDDEARKLGWQSETRKSPKFCPKERIDETDPDKAWESFSKLVTDTMTRAGQKELLVWVHGCNNTFEAAALKAAKFAYHAKLPVVLYSWPSTGSLLSYRIDEGNVEWSQEHFDRFLDRLNELCVKNKLKASVIAHSLGNRLAIWGFPHIANRDGFEEVALICPDIDNETFKHYARDFEGNETKVRLYVSTKDRVLPISQMFYGGYYRLGQGADSFLAFLSNPAELLDAASDLLQDSGRKKGNEIADKDAQAITRELEKQRFEMIDFTEVDRGFLGHSIPFSVIANMSARGVPGEGLRLEPEEAGRRSVLTRFMRWFYDLVPPQAGHRGFCERVVRVPRAASNSQASAKTP